MYVRTIGAGRNFGDLEAEAWTRSVVCVWRQTRSGGERDSYEDIEGHDKTKSDADTRMQDKMHPTETAEGRISTIDGGCYCCEW